MYSSSVTKPMGHRCDVVYCLVLDIFGIKQIESSFHTLMGVTFPKFNTASSLSLSLKMEEDRGDRDDLCQ